MFYETNPSEPDPLWEARLKYWRRELGRLRLGAEPVADQLARYRRATQVLSAVALGIGAIIVSIFKAFGRPGVGLTLAAILFVPVVAFAWLDDWRLRARASAYLRELQGHEGEKKVIRG